MADKRLNDLSTATDGAYIYAEDASGNQIKISKADLATVVAGINGFGLKARVILKSTDNLNSISDGMYCTVNIDNPQNMPPIEAYNNLIIQITSLRSDVFQIVMSSTQTKGMFYRVRVGAGGVWSGWYNMTQSLME